MAIDGFEIEKLLRKAFPTATIQVDDLAGDRNQFSSSDCAGVSRIN